MRFRAHRCGEEGIPRPLQGSWRQPERLSWKDRPAWDPARQGEDMVLLAHIAGLALSKQPTAARA